MRYNHLFVLSAALFMFACGNNSGTAKAPETKDSPSTAAPAATAAADKGLELIGSNDCTACHSVRKGQGPNTGPAYEDVAAKYSPAADSTVNRLIRKIKEGGNGVWGSNMMTPHPAVSDSDIRTMVTYILSIKKS
ncbi:MAG TPA: c-type cytochrome [Puia sp.]|jgi:cytochrome c|nr:c-type cytochrome [Puia sp.]